MEEHKRIEDQLKDYWQKLKKYDADLPVEEDINPDALQDIWDDCFYVQVTPDATYRFDYMGKNLIEAFEDEYSREQVEVIADIHGHHEIVEIFDQMLKHKKPFLNDGQFLNSKRVTIKYRQYLLPFGEAGEVTHILGGMRWKGY